jgi:formate/nitrite transporter FocA (FNT family)
MTKEMLTPVHSGDGETGFQVALEEVMEPHSIEATLQRLDSSACHKWSHPLSYFVQAFAGGAMVSFGVVLAVATTAGISSPGIANLIAGLVFGFSLVIIMMSQASLITADMAAGFVSAVRRSMSWPSYVAFLLFGWLGNVLGALAFVAVVAYGGGPWITKVFLTRAHEIATAKLALPALSTFLLAIVCTWLLQTAMFLFYKARTDVGRMILAWYGPFAFVAAMTEHCIANAGFAGLALLEQAHFLALVHHGLVAGSAPILSWGFGKAGLLRDELLATAGNLVGGTLMVAGVFLLIARLRRS